MLRVHHDHFLQRFDHDLLRRINYIVKNARIVKRFACLIVARRRGAHEPPALATQAVLRDSLQELTIEEAKPRHHCIAFDVDNDILDC